MRITDRYQTLTADRANAAGAAKPVEKTEKVGGGARAKSAPKGQATSSRVLDVNVSERAHELASGGVARLDELKSAISNGTFQVDAELIASRLVGDE